MKRKRGGEDFFGSGGLVDGGRVARVVVVRPVRQSVVMWRRLRGRCGLGKGVVVFWGALDDVVMWGIGGVVVLSDAPGDVTTRVVGAAIGVMGGWEYARESSGKRKEGEGEAARTRFKWQALGVTLSSEDGGLA